MVQKRKPSKYLIDLKLCHDCKQPYTSNLLECPRCGSDIWGNLYLFKRNDDGTITIN